MGCEDQCVKYDIDFRRLRLWATAAVTVAWVVLVQVAQGSPPTITPLVPGLVAEEIPVQLSNINNLRFSPGGQLTALGYNGKVYLLSDTNGDGLEDSVKVFWERPTIRVPVGMAWSDQGLYVSSQGKVSLLRDTNIDGVADSEEVIASGWERTDVGSGGVDATAVTLDAKGNIYFAVICANYSNPYRLKEGRSQYDIKSRRGTINRLSREDPKLEVLCTGIRVPYALAFNRHGDLFVTDQEGETWLPGGNPLDELNQILPGKHYGFPPRHAEYLPEVIDEPPVVAFGPQHQSTCGLVFNEATTGHASFGPEWWEGDAFVAGESRGKIWRVPLVKTPQGYVGTPIAIARSTMLLTDVAVSPAGDLYVACHSGPPDWGTGPEGAGKLFRIRLADRKSAQPVLAYTSSPLEVRIAFDRPVGPKILEGLTDQQIEYGKYVRAADKLEVLKPPYKTVKEQEKQPRGKLRVAAARVVDGGRTVALRTDPHPVPGTYSLALNEKLDSSSKAPSQAVFLDYDLSGLQATWTSAGSVKPVWSGWLPHVDLDVVRSLVGKSQDHAELLGSLQKPGRLEFHGLIKLPKGRVTIRLESNAECELQVGEARGTSTNKDEHRQVCEVTADSIAQPLGLNATFHTGIQAPELHLSYHTATDPTERVVALPQLFVPWSPAETTVIADEKMAEPVRVTGDARRGEAIFTGQVAKCSVCHAIHGVGAKVGPDLSQLVHRDPASILRDIREPSAMINPDYVSYTLNLSDGRTATGVLRAEGADSVRLASSEAQETVIPVDTIEEMHPQSISMMPQGLLDKLSAAETQDLLAYLVAPPPSTSKKSSLRTHSRAELESILRAATLASQPADTKPLTITLVSGKQDHGPGEHDYPAWQQTWTKLLMKADKVTVDTAKDWPNAEQWKRSDVIVFYLWNHDWSPERYRDLDTFLARGGGVVAIHSALIADSNPEKLAERWGLAAQPKRTRYRHGPLELEFDSQSGNAIIAGFSQSPMVDETYWPMIGDPNRVRVLATTIEDGQSRPMLWTYQPGKGRVFASVLGHYTKTLDDPWFQILLLRGIAWAADEPLTRVQAVASEGF